MKFPLLLIATTVLALAGCGGGGGGSSAGASRVYITDDLNTGYDHVWVSLKSVTLTGSNGNVVVMNDTAGKVVDLRTLRDSTGSRFLLLGTDTIPSGTYTSISITLDKNLVLYPTGATTGTNAVFADSGTTDKVITHTFTPAATVASGGGLVIDFDLANWQYNAGIVTAPGGFIDRHNGDGLEDRSRHEDEDYEGTVSGLSGTAPTQTFMMGDTSVETSATTVLYDESGAVSPVLANGKRVEVRGSFDVASRRLIADSIKIEDENETEDRPKADGTVTSINAQGLRFVVDVREVEGFLPASKSVTVVVSQTTKFFGGSGITILFADFFTTLAVDQRVKVRGTYDTETATFVATEVKIKRNEGGGGGDDDDHDEGEIKGPIQSVNAQAFSMVVRASEWEGMNIAPNTNITVTTTEETRFDGPGSEENLSRTAFFGQTNLVGATYEIKGSYDPATQTIVAERIKFDD